MTTTLPRTNYALTEDLVFHAGDQATVVFSAYVGIAVYVTPDLAETLAKRNATLAQDIVAGLDDEMICQLVAAGILRTADADPAAERRAALEAQIKTGRTIRFLDLVVSEGCNYGCTHCIHSRDIETGPFRMLNTYMSPETAKRAIDEFVSLQQDIGNPELVIHIGSAEPLINWQTTRFIVEYVTTISGFSTKRITINTNLSLLSEEQARLLIDNNVVISTSLDGVKKDNDAIRVLKNGVGTFDVILGKIEMLRRLGYPMDSVSLTVTERTIRTFDSKGYVDLLRILGMTGVSIDFDLVGSADVSAGEVAFFLLAFYDLCTESGIECFGTWTKPFENLFADRSDDSTPPMPGFCKAVEGGNVAVSPQGRLFMCGYTSSPLGELDGMKQFYPQALLDLLARRSATADKHCRGCELIAACGGQCHTTHEVSSFEHTGKINVMCDVYRNVTRELAIRKVNCEVN